MPQYKLKTEQRKWEGRSVTLLPYQGKDENWKEVVKPWTGCLFKVASVYLSADRKVVFLELGGLPGLAFDAYKDVKES